MHQLFSIDELSSLQNISGQTLIFYDKIGLFCPAYINPNNGYRHYNAYQLDELDPICIMKRIGFSLEVIKSRIEHRCTHLEQSASISKNSTKIPINHEKAQYLLLQKVDFPYTQESVSMATKKCFVRSLKEKLPVFFQSRAIVPLKNIQNKRYTETSFAFSPVEAPHYTDVLYLPEEKCVSTYPIGDYLSISTSYERLLKYCRISHLTILSDAYEFVINDYLSTKDENAYITRILFYVK